MPSARSTSMLVLVLLASLLTSERGYAQRYDRHAFAGPTVAIARPGASDQQWGIGGQLALAVALDGFWSVVAAGEGAWHPSIEDPQRASFSVYGASIGARYNLDVFAYIPYLTIAGVFWGATPPGPEDDPEPAAALKVSLGLDWRPARAWGLGAALELYSPPSSAGSLDLYSTCFLYASTYF